jgi:hypothetical protein
MSKRLGFADRVAADVTACMDIFTTQWISRKIENYRSMG